MHYIGYDIGSSSIKAALIDGNTNRTLAFVQVPDKEMSISSPEAGWAEQDPELWWDYVAEATRALLDKTHTDGSLVTSIGISYQMHGLVAINKEQQVVRPSIIWCDGRAVNIGLQAFSDIGEEKCLEHLLNSPGNFTASKLKWVKENEPELYAQIDKVMLPGDFIAMKLTGEVNTTIPGLSEGMIWDFKNHQPSNDLLGYYGIDQSLLPEIVPTFSVQGEVSTEAAQLLGIKKGCAVSYRGGDQPNNAMSLGVLEPGQVAGTGGTSGVIYGISERPAFDPKSRVNSFAHVNYTKEQPLTGVLLCINGAGIQYRWLNQEVADTGMSYVDMESLASKVPVGSDGVRVLPFGNGAERVLGNRDIGSHIQGLQFNRHHKAHLFRAGLEGIAFSFVYGGEIMQSMGMKTDLLRVGNDNLFQSEIFSSTIATLLQTKIEIVETTGAIGAARAAAYATGQFSNLSEAMSGNEVLKVYQPNPDQGAYQEAWQLWKEDLNRLF